MDNTHCNIDPTERLERARYLNQRYEIDFKEEGNGDMTVYMHHLSHPSSYISVPSLANYSPHNTAHKTHPVPHNLVNYCNLNTSRGLDDDTPKSTSVTTHRVHQEDEKNTLFSNQASPNLNENALIDKDMKKSAPILSCTTNFPMYDKHLQTTEKSSPSRVKLTYMDDALKGRGSTTSFLPTEKGSEKTPSTQNTITNTDLNTHQQFNEVHINEETRSNIAYSALPAFIQQQPSLFYDPSSKTQQEVQDGLSLILMMDGSLPRPGGC